MKHSTGGWNGARPHGKRLLVLAPIVAAVLATMVPAHAESATDLLGAQGAQLVGADVLTGKCQIEFLAAGVGGNGGIPYRVQAAGTAVGADVVATEVSCRVWQDGSTLYDGASGYLDGAANAIPLGNFTEQSLDPLETCVQVSALTNTGNTIRTQWLNSTGGACSIQ